MPASDARARKEPEAALRGLCASACAVVLIAQPGEVRVLTWMVKQAHNAAGVFVRGSLVIVALITRARTPAKRATHRSLTAKEGHISAGCQDNVLTDALYAKWWAGEGRAIAEQGHV